MIVIDIGAGVNPISGNWRKFEQGHKDEYMKINRETQKYDEMIGSADIVTDYIIKKVDKVVIDLNLNREVELVSLVREVEILRQG